VIRLISIKTNELKKKEILQICNLKNTKWNYGVKSQFTWFKKNIKEKDIHILLYLKNNLVGYLSLRRGFLILKKKKKKFKKKFLLFDTFVIKKKFRNKKLSYLLMLSALDVISKTKLLSCLICKKSLLFYYLKFNWKKISKFIIKIPGKNLKGFNILYFQRKINNKLFQFDNFSEINLFIKNSYL
jgi:hypothetical protein